MTKLPGLFLVAVDVLTDLCPRAAVPLENANVAGFCPLFRIWTARLFSRNMPIVSSSTNSESETVRTDGNRATTPIAPLLACSTHRSKYVAST